MPESTGRVAYVITTTAIGGAERQVFDLASEFRSRGWEVGVVCLAPLHEQFLKLHDQGVKLVSLDMRRGIPDPRALWRMARILREWRPTVVHAHMVHANLLARLSRLIAPVPRLISTIHSQDEGSRWRYWAYRLTDRASDLTTTVSGLAVSEAVRRHAVPGDRIRLVPNGILTADYEADPTMRRRTRASLGLDGAFTWLSVGRLIDLKRHTDLLSAIQTLMDPAPDVRLLIAGDGPLRASLEQEVGRAGLGANVELLGEREDVPALMQAADGFVMSSVWEGLPMVMLEASASALPIVATDVGGSRDIVEDGVTGFLTPPQQPARLAAAMLRVMRLPPQDRRAMGDRARRRVTERFDLRRIADEWERLYRSS
jgi:glycosyltransferase involved in cell wall biosynthesis